jgi:palmitoyltransferase ZDHHC13/17
LTVNSHCPWIYNCVGVNNHRHFFIYLINLTLGVIVFDFLTYYHLRALRPTASDQCNLLSAEWCRFVNADTFTLLLAMWATLQLTWVTMLLFVQFVQVSRAMTTYENMFGVDRHGAGSLASSFTSTGVALGDAAMHPPSGSAAQPDAGVDPHAGHAHGPGGHKHGSGGFLKTWSRLLGVDAFVETAMGRGAAVGNTNKKRRRRNPYSHGLVANCKDFWCDPAPVFGRRENGAAALDGAVVNYTEMYETPTGMDAMRPRSGGGARRGGGYEAVAAEEV